MNFSFLVDLNYPIMQRSYFCNNFFLCFIETYLSFKYFKRFLNLIGNLKLNWGTFLLWFFDGYNMIYANVGDFKDPLKQKLALEFYRNQNKDFSILTETHINHDKIHHIRNTPSNNRVLCVCATSGHNSREQLSRGEFFERQQNYMENKSEGNENKIILGNFNYTMDKMDTDGGNTKTL